MKNTSRLLLSAILTSCLVIGGCASSSDTASTDQEQQPTNYKKKTVSVRGDCEQKTGSRLSKRC